MLCCHAVSLLLAALPMGLARSAATSRSVTSGSPGGAARAAGMFGSSAGYASFDSSHNGGWYHKEELKEPVAGTRPHIMMVLFDDYGWADAGWHRVDVRTGKGTSIRSKTSYAGGVES